MIEDKIEIKYPIEKLSIDKFDKNQKREKLLRKITIEYVLHSGEKAPPSVFLRGERDTNQIEFDNNSLERGDSIANEVLSFDTCFRLFLALRKTEYRITPQVDLIGRNHIIISDFIKYVEETIWTINYYNEEKLNSKQLSNNLKLKDFIKEHAKWWPRRGDGYEFREINNIELDKDDRKKLSILLRQLDYASTKPYYIYEKMAAVVDKGFYYKRRLLRTLNTVNPCNVENSKLFTCFVLNSHDFKKYIMDSKDVFIRFVEDTINSYLSVGLSETDIKVVEIVRRYLNRENNTKYQKRYSWNKKPEGCVGLLISPKNNFFSFSGYKDVNNSKLREEIHGAGDKLSTLIKDIEKELSKYQFTSEITNIDERYYEKKTSTFYTLQSELPLADIKIADIKKPRYQCAEKKLFSHVYKNITPEDNIFIIVTFRPCSERGCQDLIDEYKKLCKSIRTFYIGNYNTGTIVEC
ncbi:hypothetical protein [Gemella morbillorum]|uniref:hypothetical protein n=1 Tax=Gemella morbillorum TaxID=29391 RepID=UPI0023F3BE96|nr:hypothetical protein [Gemella morbillorum]